MAWVRELDICESTNDEARELVLQGAPTRSWVKARTQSCGRGQHGRVWESSIDGNLYLSMIFRYEKIPPGFNDLPLVVTAAILKTLEHKYPSLSLAIKHPNDLVTLMGKKIGGVLVESTGSFAVVGIGVNCTHAPQGLDQPTESLSGILNEKVNADAIVTDVIKTVGDWVEGFLSRIQDHPWQELVRTKSLRSS